MAAGPTQGRPEGRLPQQVRPAAATAVAAGFRSSGAEDPRREKNVAGGAPFRRGLANLLSILRIAGGPCTRCLLIHVRRDSLQRRSTAYYCRALETEGIAIGAPRTRTTSVDMRDALIPGDQSHT